MTVLRALSLCLWTGLMTLTGVGVAMARGHMAAEGVICGAGDYAVVLAADGLPLFDDEGDPVAAQALPCLDCIFGQLALPSGDPETGATHSGQSALTPTPHHIRTARLWRMGGMGRSPPREA